MKNANKKQYIKSKQTNYTVGNEQLSELVKVKLRSLLQGKKKLLHKNTVQPE